MAERGGSIYDLGYQHYEGARLGRTRAILALYRESLRAGFGLGRSATAKVAPFVLIGIALTPAIAQLVIGALISGVQDLIRHDEYYSLVSFVLALYCAAVAPDIVGRDQRNHSLALYFSRAISRMDYALAKFAAMTTAMLAITLVPQMLLFIGNALATDSFGTYVREDSDQAIPIVLTAVLGSAMLAAIGTAIAAQTPRRAYATVGIILTFLLSIAVSAILVEEVQTSATDLAVFFSPLTLIEGFTTWMFRTEIASDSLLRDVTFPRATYALAALVWTAGGVAMLVRRYARVQA
ncbi:MAG: ABC transporter permease subunit [Dehalococcoidia bacterium]